MHQRKMVRKKRPAELKSVEFRNRSRQQMQVLKTSLKTCSRISKKRCDFILDIADNKWITRFDMSQSQQRFNKEMRYWNSQRKQFLQEVSNPYELHFFSCNWNCDRGAMPIRLVIANPACDAGTALRLYWLNDPEYYQDYKSLAECPAYEREWLKILRAIERRFLKNQFATSLIPFDPLPWITERICHGRHTIPEVMLASIGWKQKKRKGQRANDGP